MPIQAQVTQSLEPKGLDGWSTREALGPIDPNVTHFSRTNTVYSHGLMASMKNLQRQVTTAVRIDPKMDALTSN